MARQDEIRVGDADRDAVMLALHDHFAAGRLDRGELDERLDTALAAKTHGDLRALVRDLPPPTGLPEPASPAPTAVRRGPGCWGPGGWWPGTADANHLTHMHKRHMHERHMHERHMHERHMHERHTHERHMARRRHHGHGHFPAFPLLLALFLVLAFTVGPGTGVFVVLQVALAIWVIRAVLVAFGVRRSRHGV
ncbi:uncharacterized protein DUF1707 [Actinomadura pelletieri DSM 43383]|uniref:Uncharacterized protein DUF1707 n=1 Tax=Actinomadura pelletieri DSM 43383 TaxID=1120940 RepID=A0A495QB04_9ACTN|nr:DUF1707 domain-containing protein [Actinomadura pelletieri]RKS68860.1 uncharacterized protein DUF1707 [Actinomadura pelletieri DSM 43383]